MLKAALRPHIGEGAPPADLRWRLKQMQRQDWPATVADDPLLKRGYTIQQALRVLAAMALADADLGPTAAVVAARDNENAILAAMMAGLVELRDGVEPPGLGVLRPGAIGGVGEPAPGVIVPASPAGLAGLVAKDAGRALLVIDFGALARRACEACRKAGLAGALEGLDTLLAHAARETRAGRGHVPIAVPRGDRYAARGRRSRGEAAGAAG